MPEKTLTDRSEAYVKMIGKNKQATEKQINTIIQLIKSVRNDGAVDDDTLFSFFELVGDE